jgi:hypothetical protein
MIHIITESKDPAINPNSIQTYSVCPKKFEFKYVHGIKNKTLSVSGYSKMTLKRFSQVMLITMLCNKYKEDVFNETLGQTISSTINDPIDWFNVTASDDDKAKIIVKMTEIGKKIMEEKPFIRDRNPVAYAPANDISYYLIDVLTDARAIFVKHTSQRMSTYDINTFAYPYLAWDAMEIKKPLTLINIVSTKKVQLHIHEMNINEYITNSFIEYRDAIIDDIKNSRYPKRISHNCGWCDYKAICFGDEEQAANLEGIEVLGESRRF